MGNLKKLILIGSTALALLGIAKLAQAMVVKFNNYLANEAGLTYNKTYPLSLNSYGIDNLSFTTMASSVTFSNQTFTDGQLSTGSIRVATVSGLSASASTGSFTIATVTIPSGSFISVNGVQLVLDNYLDTTEAATAINVSKALGQLVPNVIFSTGGTRVVTATAVVAGLYGNGMTLASNTSSITVSGANFTGGRDPAVVSVNGYSFTAGKDFTVAALSSTTATNLMNAINASSNTTFVVASETSATTTTIIASSTFVGANTNYVITSSTQAALVIGGSTVTVQGLGGAGIGQMWGGTNASYTLVGGSASVITIASNAYPLALPVLYTVSGSAITGLTDKTTYYVTAPTAGTLALAKTSTDAVAGNLIVLTSSQSKTASDTYTLAPLAIAGSPAGIWEVSNDGVNWITYTANTSGISVASAAFSPYVSTGTVRNWDFGPIDYAFIRFNVTAPTAGALSLKVTANGKGAKE